MEKENEERVTIIKETGRIRDEWKERWKGTVLRDMEVEGQQKVVNEDKGKSEKTQRQQTKEDENRKERQLNAKDTH